MIAALAGTKTEIDLKNIYVRNVRIIGSTLRSRTPEMKARILKELTEKVWPKVESGEVKPTIYKVLPIEEAEKAHDILYDLYAPYVDLAKKRGVGIAFESLFEDRAIFGEPRSRYSCKVEEIISLIESYNDETVSCCWDFGHSQLEFGNGHFEAFKQAFKYISSTHVHDNWAGMDLHTLPTF